MAVHRASQPWGRIEYVYHRMARDAGIDMAECHLLREGGLAHFMTRRFDRLGPDRLHALEAEVPRERIDYLEGRFERLP